MKPEDKYYFNLLKQHISRIFLANNSASSTIEDWKGEDITVFQEDLFNKVKATISEKWFYTYIKNEPQKLPRIDILNILSKYIDFDNWTAFKNTHSKSFDTSKKSITIKNYAWLLLLVPIVAIFFYFRNTKNEFEFCFIDEHKNEIINTVLDIKLLQEFESPIYIKTDSLGCFVYKTKEKMLKFVVQSPFYKTDTIIRSIDVNSNATIKLQTDNYALMLHYYSNGNIKDWGKRKQQLKKLIDDNAQIYQVFSQNIGVEVYSKDEFISKLTIPTSSLKNIKILDKTSKNGKIIKLKFMIQ